MKTPAGKEEKNDSLIGTRNYWEQMGHLEVEFLMAL
jgi:hypothetical protein